MATSRNPAGPKQLLAAALAHSTTESANETSPMPPTGSAEVSKDRVTATLAKAPAPVFDGPLFSAFSLFPGLPPSGSTNPPGSAFGATGGLTKTPALILVQPQTPHLRLSKDFHLLHRLLPGLLLLLEHLQALFVVHF